MGWLSLYGSAALEQERARTAGGGRPGCLQQPQPSTASLHHSATAYRLAWVASVGGLRGLGVEKTRGDRGSSVPFVGPVPIISHGELRTASCKNSCKTAQRQPKDSPKNMPEANKWPAVLPVPARN